MNIPNRLFMALRAFVNRFASECANCIRRDPCNCSECVATDAKRLLFDIDHVQLLDRDVYFSENPINEKYRRILRALRQAHRPLTSKEIRLDGVSRALKAYTLKKMCQQKILASRVNERGHYIFYIVGNNADANNKTTNDNKEKAKWHST